MKSLSNYTKLYLVSSYLLGLAIFGWHIWRVQIDQSVLLIILCVLASLALVLKVIGATNNSHYTFSFLVYGFSFVALGLPQTLIVILVSNLVEWFWNNPKWYGQLFNISNYVIAMWVASVAYSWINPTASVGTWQAVLAVFVSMAAFNGVNHLMVGIVVWLATGENFKKSGIFEFFPLMLDLALLVFGASLSIVWHYSAFAVLLFSMPLYLVYSTLRVPALERKTEIDPKTGLFNHEYFKKQLANELARANRFDRPISVILADLDLLRNINNTYGHLAGDEVLIRIAHAMKDAVRDYDVVCRFGGEEFAILLPETTLAQAFERAESIRRKVEGLEFTVPTSIKPIRATLSLGVAHRENFNQSQDEITHNADLALYQSKLSGRNRTFAISNETYLNVFDDGRQPARLTSQPTTAPSTLSNSSPSAVESTDQEPVAATGVDEKPAPAGMEPASAPDPKTSSPTRRKLVVTGFIGGLGLLALLSVAGLIFWALPSGALPSSDWIGLLVIASLIVFSEIFSIDLYAKQSSVSTSAIPILLAFLLFESMGVILASVVLALSLLIKFRSPFNRFIFNLSNHILAGTLIVSVLAIMDRPFLTLPVVFQIGISLIAAGILYLVTTWMIAIGMGLDLNQSIRKLWQEQFSWLAPYYLGMGLIAYALVFGYQHDHLTGLLLMVIPMVFLRISQAQYIERTREVVAELREKNLILKKNSEEITDLSEGLLITLAEIIDLRDPRMPGHSKLVSEYAVRIAKRMGMNVKQTDLIRKAGLLHDIAKLGIRVETLSKEVDLSPAENALVTARAELGVALVKNSSSLRPIVHVIRHHHERFDGKGYPDHIAGNQISIEARIIAVADSIESMTSDRRYRRAFTLDKVKTELQKGSGHQFDPLVVDAAIKMLEQVASNQAAQSTLPETDSDLPARLATDPRTA